MAEELVAPDPEADAQRGAAERFAAATRPFLEEMLDSCDGASSSAREAGGVAIDIDTGAQRLDAAISATVAAMDEIRARADSSTSDAVTSLSAVRERVTAGAQEIGRLAES